MTVAEILSLAALVATVVGWLVNFSGQRRLQRGQAKMQKDLQLIQEDFNTAREKRSYLVPRMLDELQTINNWFVQGNSIGQDLLDLIEHQPLMKDDTWRPAISRMHGRIEVWLKSYTEHYGLILRLEPAANTYQPSARGFDEMLSNLGQSLQKPLLAPLAEELRDMINNIFGDIHRTPDNVLACRGEIDENFYKATSVITRMRQDILDR